jgi:GH15 family glucan-1,4-alpha-glucosidase
MNTGAGRPSLELGVIGNCEVAALIDESASIVWGCLPALDGDPTFCALLGEDTGESASGIFAIDLRDAARTTQRYLRNTAILETVLHDAHGNALRVRDFCPRHWTRGRMFRPAMYVRIVEPLQGRPIARVRLRPRCEYGASVPRTTRGSHHIAFHAPSFSFRLTTNASLSAITSERYFEADEPLAFLIGPDSAIEEHPLVLATTFFEATRAYWEDWVRSLAVPFEWQEAVIRAAIALKLCTYEDTGAVLAALTTSIPESPGSGRNWDYRYCWLRDSYFVIHALNRLGATRTMEGYLRYIKHTFGSDGSRRLQPLFSITGDPEVPERQVDGLTGYRGMGPVRVGNDAYQQDQHDVYGALILASAHSFCDERMSSPGDEALFNRLEPFGTRALESWQSPDAGPWEFRGARQPHTFSAAMCWAGCDRLARIAGRLALPSREVHWRGAADDIREQVLSRSWNPTRGAFCSSFGGNHVDATALVLPELGIVSPRDPRFLSTLEAVERDLKEGHWIYRYRHEDDFGAPETAFTICAFWYVNALAAVGRREQAREMFEYLLSKRTRLGLLSEDIDPSSGELWGNFPQTYSLVGIINSAVRLSRSWEEAM